MQKYASDIRGDYDAAALVALAGRFDRVEGDGVLVTASGDTTLVTPATGKALRLRWVFISAGDSGIEVIATVKLGSDTVYKFPLTVPGAFAHSSCREGAVDEVLSINLSAARDVYVNYEYEEVS